MDERPAPDPGSANLAWASALLRGLIRGGVTRFVISPGSRSTPLALAIDIEPLVRSWVMPDERSAAFLTLGLARGSGQPAGLIGTSGTAVANWLPAVVEADADGVPLLAISADRPPELHDTGANQTIRQDDLFGSRVRRCFSLGAHAADGPGLSYPESVGIQAAQLATWPAPGPVHINAMFREPLVPLRLPEPTTVTGPCDHSDRPTAVPSATTLADLTDRLEHGSVAIVAGRMRPDPTLRATITALAERLGCPILADPLSGLRWGAHDRSRVITTYDTFLRSPGKVEELQAATVLQFGAAPTSRALQQFVAHPGTHLWLVAPNSAWPDPDRCARRRVSADPETTARLLLDRITAQPDRAWIARWQSAAGEALTLMDDLSCRPAEADIIRVLQSAAPREMNLFVGNSMPIRLLDTFGIGSEVPMDVYGNRGASGIDGNIATLAGLAQSTAGAAVGLIGDLALFHDMNGLLALRDCDATLIVINNDGGGMFDLLPQRDLASFERLWQTPTGLDPARIAALYGIRHRHCPTSDTLVSAYTDAVATGGADLIECPVERAHSSHALRTLWERSAHI